jgi:hypothetical protein
VIFKVQRTADDPTPVPDVDITLDVGGSNVSGIFFADPNFSALAGDGFHWKTRTDDQGVVMVYPVFTFGVCGGATEDIEGFGGVTATIAADQEVFSVTTTLDCTP